jgi:competence protein ComEC
MRASFYVITLGFIMGVFWRSFFEIGLYGIAALLLGIIFVFGVSVLMKFHTSVGYGALFILVLILGVIRTEIAFENFKKGYVYYEGEEVSIEGMVFQEPDVRDEYTVLYVELSNSAHTRVRVIAQQHSLYTYGDLVLMRGVIRKPESFETDTGRIFNYRGYLMKDSVHYQVKRANVEMVGINKGNVLRKKLYEIKQRWLQSVNNHIPEPAASLAGGVTVGAKNSLGEEWLDAFRDTGIIHIVVLSGYNLTLIANSVVRMTLSLPRSIGFGLGVASVIGFASMVGAGATVVRASVMAILGMLSTFLRRPYMLLRALILAGFAMVLWNPFILAYDPGFQLSFVATAGLILISPYFEKRLTWIPDTLGFRAIIAATFATQLAVLPLLMFIMGRVSLIAPLVNILILPIVPFIMFASFVTGVFDMFGIFLAAPFAFMSYVGLTYIFHTVDLLNQIPFAAVTLPLFPWWGMVLVYILLILFLVKNQKNTRP